YTSHLHPDSHPLMDSDAARTAAASPLGARNDSGRRSHLLHRPRVGMDCGLIKIPIGYQHPGEQHMKTSKSILLVMFTFPLLFAWAQQPQGQSRGGRSADEYVKLLESERRIEGLQVSKVIEALKVKPDDHVCDLGSGSGLFTRPMAKRASGKGVVYAVDID